MIFLHKITNGRKVLLQRRERVPVIQVLVCCQWNQFGREAIYMNMATLVVPEQT